MKATGIVRRIDDLGRVVIPKEIRRTMRIREGDPLEIYTDNDGEVIFKKYSPVGELADFAVQMAESVSKQCMSPVVVLDRDGCIACSGISKREVIGRRVSQQSEELMEQRSKFVASADAKPLYPIEGVDRAAVVFVPIISSGDISGAVIILESENLKLANETHEKLCMVAAEFLSKQMEE